MRLKFSALMLGAALAAIATAADARAVKWARAADALTLDPHGQNEGPTIAFNGDRSSWETVARNSSFKRLALSACVRAARRTE